MYNRKLYYSFLSIAFFYNVNLKAQYVDAKDNLNLINAKVIEYLKNKGEFSKNDIDQNLIKRFHVFEVLKKEPIGFRKRGVYGVRVMKAPSKTYLLLKNNDFCEMLDLRDSGNTLKTTITFLKDGFVESDSITMYVKEIISLYEQNGYNSKGKM